jgi:vanillate/3-O-methylgallate O-demethylase
MRDLFISGPDATRLLSDYSANNYENFAVGRATQFVPVTAQGHIVQDGILMCDAEDRYTLTGPPASQSWILFHGQHGGYDVEFKDDPDSASRPGDPVLFRYQVQGPHALALVEKVFGGPLPETKFFHTAPVSLGGRHFRALRHGMAGQAGYEFIGDYPTASSSRRRCSRPARSSGSHRWALRRMPPTALRAAGSQPHPGDLQRSDAGRVPPVAAGVLLRGPEAAARQRLLGRDRGLLRLPVGARLWALD